MLNLEISREELNELPLGSFDGTTHIITESRKINKVISHLRKHDYVGFDTESRPAFVKGQKFPISLTQLATEDEAFLIRNKYTGWPPALIDFLSDPSTLKIGVGIRDDLHSMRANIKTTWEPEGFVELNNVVKDLGVISQGIRKLSGLILGFRISKSAQTSNWEREVLNEKQIRYAATDAWCCFQIYDELMTRGYIE